MKKILCLAFLLVACGKLPFPVEGGTPTPTSSVSPSPSPSPSPTATPTPSPDHLVTSTVSCLVELPIHEGCEHISYNLVTYQDGHEDVSCLCNQTGHQPTTTVTYQPSDIGFSQGLCPYTEHDVGQTFNRIVWYSAGSDWGVSTNDVSSVTDTFQLSGNVIEEGYCSIKVGSQ